LGNQLWSLTAVTMAAQIVTTPLSLYYFHQFPNLFLVSNLLMIPLSTVIMYMAMVIIPFSGWSWAMIWLGKIFNGLVWLLNHIVLYIEGLPFSLTKGIFIHWLDVCLLYLLVISLTLYLVKKKALYVILGLGAVFVLLTHGLVVKYQRYTSKELLVYNDKDNIAIQFRHGSSSIWLVSGKCAHLSHFIQVSADGMQCKTNQVFLLDSIRQASQVRGVHLSGNLWIKGCYIQFFDKRIVISEGTETCRLLEKSMNVDYLVVRDVKQKAQFNLNDCYSIKNVIIPAVISGYKAKKIEKSFSATKAVLYNIENSGAFRVKL